MSKPSGFLSIDLNPFFNLDAIALKGEASYSRIDGLFALPAEELPRTGEASIEGVPFLFPDKGCMVPEGQVIEPLRDAYQAVHVLGNAVFGSAECELAFEFDGGRKLTQTLKLTDGSHFAQFGEQEAFKLGYRYGDAGPVEWPIFIWKQVVLLPSDQPLKTIIFGRSNNMRIFSLTLGRERPDLPADSLLYYLLDRIEGAAEFKRLYYVLADLGEDLTVMRDQVLDTIRVDDLTTRHDFNRWIPELETRLQSLPAKERETPLDMTLVGHSHIDAVWLWPWNVTVEKVHRTFSRNVDRLKIYPDVTFAQSQPQFYEWMERFYPDLFEEVKKLIEAGRWEIVGGMWVEPDGNMPCGEALVRQRLYGQRYYLKKFGRLSEVGWIPDTFGMHGNHPQIIRKSGGKYFFTTKLMWNYENVFPYQHFIWEAPDGSRVIALQSAVGCGAEPALHDGVEEAVKKHNVLIEPGQDTVYDYRSPGPPQGGEYIPEVLHIYGEGDGGEGPSDRHYIRAQSMALRPEFKHGTVHEYFHAIEEKYGNRLPVWRDELYLENHRGTTSSQGRMKELNRNGEVRLLEAEKWSTLSAAFHLFRPEKKEMDRVWKKLLFNQFHDILPGTSIAQAYVDVEADFDDLFRTASHVLDGSLRSLASKICTEPGKKVALFSTGRPLILFNPLMWEREETVAIPFGFPTVQVLGLDGEEIPSQVIFRDGKHWLHFHVKVPAFGYTQVKLVAGMRPVEWKGVKVEGLTAENRFYRVELDEQGHIRQIHDKEQGRDLLSGTANRVQFFKNKPREWNNWNLDPEYEKHELRADGEVKIEIVDEGPVVGAFRITRPAPEGGKVVQEIRLYRDGKRIDFVTDVDVKYTESLVKAAFPFDSKAEFVTTEVAYGTYQRPTVPKTEFEKAKWEVWTQKWLDLSGITLMNKAKYGFDVKGGCIRLTLVKGGIMPDPRTDVFTHRIEYALTSHGDSSAWKRGYEYNFPVVGIMEDEHSGEWPCEFSFASMSHDNVCFEAFKPAEEEGFVIRVYEVEGKDTPGVILDLPFDIEKAEEIDLLELETMGAVTAQGCRLTFSMGHNEIKSIRVVKMP